jgi:arylsulfatase A-like enzyme
MVLVLTSLASCGDIGEHSGGRRVVRVDEKTAYTPVTIGGTTTSAVEIPVPRQARMSSSVHNIPRGTLFVRFALRAPDDANVPRTARRRGTGGRGDSPVTGAAPARRVRAKVSYTQTGLFSAMRDSRATSCITTLDEPGVWRECRMEIPNAAMFGRIELAIDANDDVTVAVSEILIAPSAPARPPVFLLVVDAARVDRLRPFTDVVPVGTHLAALAGDGVTFTNVRASSSWTRTSVASLLTGLRPARHRVYGRLDVLAEEFITLGEVLQAGGYFTRAWSTNPNVLPVWGFGQGFDVFADVGALEWARSKTDGGTLLARVERALPGNARQPDAHYIHFMDPHEPYQPPQELLDRIGAMPGLAETFPGPKEVDSFVSEYADYVRYLGELLDFDRSLGRFVDELRERGVYEESLILVVADHGEEFFDHGGKSHGRTLFDEVIRVPAILKLPRSRDAGRVVSSSASLEDLFATLLAALDVRAPSDVDGVDLLASDAAPASRPQFSVLRLDGRRLESVVDGSWKLIVDPLNRSTSLYDLSEDSRERVDLRTARSSQAEMLLSLLEANRAAVESGWHFLFCGTEHPVTFALQVVGDVSEPQTFDLEEGDVVRVRPAGESPGFDVSMELEPYTGRDLRLGEANEVAIDDRDRIRFLPNTAGGRPTILVRTPRGVPFRFALGDEKSISTARTLNLSGRPERAVVGPGALVECPPTGDERGARLGWRMEVPSAPFVRIWYVPPTERRDLTELAPGVVERLRVLGYLN